MKDIDIDDLSIIRVTLSRETLMALNSIEGDFGLAIDTDEGIAIIKQNGTNYLIAFTKTAGDYKSMRRETPNGDNLKYLVDDDEGDY